MLILRLLYDKFQKFDDEHRDYRSENYFILSNWSHMVITAVLYYVFVKHLGPKLMENRPAFSLKKVLLIYNILQVLVNTFIGSWAIHLIVVEKPYPNLGCMLPIVDRSRMGMLELNLAYAYFLLKIVDYLDTVFFVLRKSYKQVSFLHVYHHIMISVGSFVFLRYVPGGHASVVGILNTFVHAIMYFYYFITALRPELKKSLWWKKYITQVQLGQFVFLILHFLRALLDGECQYSKVAGLFGLTQNVIMVVLFSKFYYHAYLSKPKSQRKVK